MWERTSVVFMKGAPTYYFRKYSQCVCLLTSTKINVHRPLKKHGRSENQERGHRPGCSVCSKNNGFTLIFELFNFYFFSGLIPAWRFFGFFVSLNVCFLFCTLGRARLEKDNLSLGIRTTCGGSIHVVRCGSLKPHDTKGNECCIWTLSGNRALL